MSGIAGLFYLDGRPVESETIGRMSAAIAFRGPDAGGTWHEGSLGLAQRALWTTPEQEQEQQPVMDQAAGLVLVLDGRVDNRTELISQLQSAGVQARSVNGVVTDADLVLRAYQVWGEESPRRIIGEFAYAIWDRKLGRLFCVRDALGVRPFYYYRGENFFAFASDPAAMFILHEVEKRPNLDALADFLVNNQFDGSTTEFENLFRLWHAHTLTVGPSSFQIQRYWNVDPDRVLQLSRPEEYEEALRDVLRTAVLAQSRTRGWLGVSLSGGLDSGSIVSILEDSRRRGDLTADLWCCGVVFDGQSCDESHYMRSVQERWGTSIRWLRPKSPVPAWSLPECLRGDAQPLILALAFMLKAAFDAAFEDGVRVVMGGLGGDDFLDAPLRYVSDLVASGHPLRSWSYIKNMTRFHSLSMPVMMRHSLLPPLIARLPKWLRRTYRFFRPPRTHSWLRSPHAERVLERLRSEPWFMKDSTFRRADREAVYRIFNSGSRVLPNEWWDRLAAAAGPVEARQPLSDRRVVELAVSIPFEHMVPSGETKGLLRNAMKGLLPDTIRQRPDKGDFTVMINTQFIDQDQAAARSLMKASLLEEMGLIHARAVVDELETFCRRRLLTDPEGHDKLWSALVLEVWAQKGFGDAKGRN